MLFRKIPLLMILLMIALTACTNFKPAPKPEVAKVAHGVTIEGTSIEGFDSEKLKSFFNEVAANNNFLSKNAQFDDSRGQILPSKVGRRLDIQATVDKALRASPGETLSFIYHEELPNITTDQLRNAKQIGSYKTPILDNGEERLENIRLTAKFMNNSIIPPGYSFSFNNRAGDVTPERGFKYATIYGDNGRVEPGLGGGMCQVCTTLYNAAMASGLPILERHPHSRPVDYIQAGLDATTYTDKDLKFLNNTTSTLVIKSFLTNTHVVVDILKLD